MRKMTDLFLRRPSVSPTASATTQATPSSKPRTIFHHPPRATIHDGLLSTGRGSWGPTSQLRVLALALGSLDDGVCSR